MITIFYVPGTFGSTIEYVLRSHTQEYSIDPIEVLENGSMHGFKKMAHLLDVDQLEDYLKVRVNDIDIRTPIYPCQTAELEDILKIFKKYQTDNDRNILIYFDTFESGEQNLLFQYYKIAKGLHPDNPDLDYLANTRFHDFTKWNPNYQNWRDLEPWQFREWFSIFYPSKINSLIQSPKLVDENFLKISNTQILVDTKQTLTSIIDFCQLTVKKNLDDFVQEWQDKQQYILQEYKMLCTIVENTVKKQMYTWPTLNIISESIIQQKLRQHGYELKCDGLNEFPTNALDLHALLEPNWRMRTLLSWPWL